LRKENAPNMLKVNLETLTGQASVLNTHPLTLDFFHM
jgi:hypothetical protein